MQPFAMLLIPMMMVAVETQPAPAVADGLRSPYEIKNQAFGGEERADFERAVRAEVGFLTEVLRTNDGDTEDRGHRREIAMLERVVIDLAVVEVLIAHRQFEAAAERMDGVFRQLGKVESVFGVKRVPMFMSSGENLRNSLQGLVLRHLDAVKKAYRAVGVDILQLREPPVVIDKSLYTLGILMLENDRPQSLFNLHRPMKTMSKYQCYVWAGKPVKHRDDTWWYEGKEGVMFRCAFQKDRVVTIEEEEAGE